MLSVLLSQLDHLALVSHADHACEAERASEYLLGEALEALEVSRLHKDGVVNVYRHWDLPPVFGALRTQLEELHGESIGVRKYIRVLQLLAEMCIDAC